MKENGQYLARQSSRAELEAGEQQDLGQQHSKGQVGVDVVALVADGADRRQYRECDQRDRQAEDGQGAANVSDGGEGHLVFSR